MIKAKKAEEICKDNGEETKETIEVGISRLTCQEKKKDIQINM